jgi:hypothetical protein
MLRSAVRIAATAVALALPIAAAAQNSATPSILRDFLTQNVCLDGAGKVLADVSPADRDPRCVGQRDLRPGEPLPYHKHDHPSPDQRAAAPTGYQRHDSFPVETLGLGTVVEQSFDFGAGDGRRFGVFDNGSDGGDIAVLSPGVAAIGATEDAAGFGLWVGECRGEVTPAALGHSWIIAEAASGRPMPDGETIARLNGVRGGRHDACPARFNAAYTRWHIAPFRYRAAPGQGKPVTLTTLISAHYGGADPVSADHVERFYFTRELGGTRWERWQNAGGDAQFSAAAIDAAAKRFAASGRCSAVAPPAGAHFLLVDCREWSDIVPPADPAGDRPGFFIAALRQRPDMPAFFAAPGAHR